jgi:hypothetical protein
MSYGINHQVGIKASPEEIYKYLTETAKLAGGGQRTREVVAPRSGMAGLGPKLPDDLPESGHYVSRIVYNGAPKLCTPAYRRRIDLYLR